jgi:hypothetical protein
MPAAVCLKNAARTKMDGVKTQHVGFRDGPHSLRYPTDGVRCPCRSRIRISVWCADITA